MRSPWVAYAHFEQCLFYEFSITSFRFAGRCMNRMCAHCSAMTRQQHKANERMGDAPRRTGGTNDATVCRNEYNSPMEKCGVKCRVKSGLFWFLGSHASECRQMQMLERGMCSFAYFRTFLSTSSGFRRLEFEFRKIYRVHFGLALHCLLSALAVRRTKLCWVLIHFPASI